MTKKNTPVRRSIGWICLFSLIATTLVFIMTFESSLSNSYFNLYRAITMSSSSTSSSADLIGMGGESWRTYTNLHGFTVSIQHETTTTTTCHDFFGLWPSDCVDNYNVLEDKMKTISAQMVAMSTNFTLMTTSSKNCVFKYPRINVQVFNTTQVLLECGFASAFTKMNSWKKSRFTRISDILRICLATKLRMAYMDTDVHYLHLNKTLFECTYVGAQMWSNRRNAIEITNAAFCLPPTILYDMSRYQINRIIKGSDDFFYTELGPSMFHNVSYMK